VCFPDQARLLQSRGVTRDLPTSLEATERGRADRTSSTHAVSTINDRLTSGADSDITPCGRLRLGERRHIRAIGPLLRPQKSRSDHALWIVQECLLNCNHKNLGRALPFTEPTLKRRAANDFSLAARPQAIATPWNKEKIARPRDEPSLVLSAPRSEDGWIAVARTGLRSGPRP
jgi:hypothetical protein